MEPSVTGLFLTVLPELAKWAGQRALNQVRTPVDVAIRATQADFPKYPDLADWLENWCASPSFFQLQASIGQGDRVDAQGIIESFSESVGTISPDVALECAQEVLPVFLRHLDERLLGSGLAIVDRRQEIRHMQVISGLESIRATLSSVTHIESSVPQPTAAANTDTPIRNETERGLDAQLGSAKMLSDSGRPKSASAVLDAARPLVLATDSSALRFRLEALTGTCLLQLGRADVAETHLQLAVSLRPDNARARANLSRAIALLGRKEAALSIAREALRLDPMDPYVAAVYIDQLPTEIALSEIPQITAEHAQFTTDPHFLRSVGEQLHGAGRYKDVVEMLKGKLLAEVHFAATWELYGRSILAEALDTLRTEQILPWQIPESLRTQLLEAVRAFTAAVDLLEKTESTNAGYVYVNRATARRWLGTDAEAEADCDRALSSAAELPEANYAKAVLLLDRGEYSGALDCLRRIKSQDAFPEAKGALGLAYLGTGQYRDALHPLTEVYTASERDPKQRIRAADLLTHAYRKIGDFERAGQIASDVASHFPDEPEALCVLAEHKERAGDLRGAQDDFEQAYNRSRIKGDSYAALDIAAFYFRRQMYADAARVYAAVASVNMHPRVRANYAAALLNSGQYAKALEFACDVRVRHGPDPQVADVEIRICELIGDLAEANARLQELRERHSEVGSQVAVRLATNFYRMRQNDRSVDWLRQVSRAELAGNADLLMQAAKLRHWLGMDESIDYAYDAWISARDRPDIALSFVLITLARQESGRRILETDVATVGCRVELKAGEDERVIDIVEDDQPEIPPARVRAASALGSKLLGVRKDDHVELSGTVYTVAGVRTKYVAAHLDVLRDFQLAFLDRPWIRRIELAPQDLSPLLGALEQRHEFATAALRLYREKQITLGGLASILGDTLLDVWLSLAKSEPSERILCSEADPAELDSQMRAVRQSDAIVIEPTALFTVARLRHLDLLSRRFSEIYVAQAVVDELLEAKVRSTFGPASSGWVGKVGERYVFSDEPQLAFEKDRQEILDTVLGFITTKTKVVPCRAQLELPAEDFAKLEKEVRPGPLAAVLVARERSLPLFSDDLALRTSAVRAWRVSGFSTQRFLVNAQERGLLTAPAVLESISTLIENRYYLVQIDTKYLLWLFEVHHLELAPEVMRGINILSDPNCSVASVVRVGASVIATCWVNRLPEHFRHLALDGVLGALTQARSAGVVLRAFSVEISNLLGSHRAENREIQRTIRLWSRVLRVA